jgi:hypothetical protein
VHLLIGGALGSFKVLLAQGRQFRYLLIPLCFSIDSLIQAEEEALHLILEWLLTAVEHLALHEEVLPDFFTECVGSLSDYCSLEDVLRRCLLGFIASVASTGDFDRAEHYVLWTGLRIAFLQNFGKE